MSVVLTVSSGFCPPVFGCGALDSLGGSLAGDAASSVFSAMTSWLASGAVDLVNHVLALLTAPTSPAGQVVSNRGSWPMWFTKEEGVMLVLMGMLILPILLVSTVGAIVRQDLTRLTRTWLVALPLSIVSALVGLELTRGALSLTDSLSSAVLTRVEVAKDIGGAIGAIGSSGAGTTDAGPVVIVVVAGLAIVAGIMLWLELVLRSAAVYVALLFLPLAMSGLVWPTTTRMAKRLVELLVTLIASKFVVAAVLALGANAVGGGGEDGALTGAAMLLLAGFAPFTLLRMVPIVEAGAVAHLEGLSRRPAHAATRMTRSGVGLGQTGAGIAAGPIGAALGIARRVSPGPLEASAVAAGAVPEHQGEYSPGGAGGAGGAGGGSPGGGGAGGGSGGSPGGGGGRPGGSVPGGSGSGGGGSGGGGSGGGGGGGGRLGGGMPGGNGVEARPLEARSGAAGWGEPVEPPVTSGPR